MQTIYLTDIRRLAPLERELVPFLGPERLEKARSYRLPQDRLRCLAGGLLIEGIAQGREIVYNENGKPLIPEGPWFSLSHSGNFACLALSAVSPVGIDIEIRRQEDFEALGKTAFHPTELAFLLQKTPLLRRNLGAPPMGWRRKGLGRLAGTSAFPAGTSTMASTLPLRAGL
jgi:phosphopantetheinyl transferase